MPTGLVDLAQHFRFAGGPFWRERPATWWPKPKCRLTLPFPVANGLGACETQECAESGDVNPQVRLEEIFPALALRTAFRDLEQSPVHPTASRLHPDHMQKVHANSASAEGSSAPN